MNKIKGLYKKKRMSGKDLINSLKKILPTVIWVGKHPVYCQPASLVFDEDGDFSYVMSNDPPTNLPRGVTHFPTYVDFEQWVTTINEQFSQIEKDYTEIQTLGEIAKCVNQLLDYPYLPVSIFTWKENEFRCRSVTMFLKQLKMELQSKMNTRTPVTRFLQSNGLLEPKEELSTISIEEITSRIEVFKSLQYPAFEKLLLRHYQPKMDDESPASILRLAKRSQVPFIAARMFIVNQKNKERLVESDAYKRKQMKKRWNT